VRHIVTEGYNTPNGRSLCEGERWKRDRYRNSARARRRARHADLGALRAAYDLHTPMRTDRVLGCMIPRVDVVADCTGNTRRGEIWLYGTLSDLVHDHTAVRQRSNNYSRDHRRPEAEVRDVHNHAADADYYAWHTRQQPHRQQQQLRYNHPGYDTPRTDLVDS